MGQEYSELSKAKLELEYLRVEPFLTVYSFSEESLEIKKDVKKLEARIVELNRELMEQKNKFENELNGLNNLVASNIAFVLKLFGHEDEDFSNRVYDMLEETYKTCLIDDESKKAEIERMKSVIEKAKKMRGLP